MIIVGFDWTFGIRVFSSPVRLVQISNENSSLESKSLLHIYGCGTWFILICNLLGYYLQFPKKCNISNSGEQKNISQMFAIDIYV